jgi:UDP-N-acetylglucosamine--N-acetylmuramyl-(pentapeptide) pyrophosphoryl-undecaprenol N-acetylglucosamine transferase
MHIAHASRALHAPRIAIAAGGTAGHVYPALAVAEAYRAAVPDVDVLFLGTAAGAEARLVPAHGYRLATLDAAPFVNVGTLGRVRSIAALAGGAAQARRILRAGGVELVLGLGNYAAAGAVLAAWWLRLATVVHEANAVAGVANRMLGRLVDRVLLGFASAAPCFPAGKVLVTGTPVRAAVCGIAGARTTPRAPGPARLLVLGGSRGSAFLNAHLPEVVASVVRRGVALEVCHQTGPDDTAGVRASYRSVGLSADVQPYLDDVAGAYRWADLAVVCAGAGTLEELAVSGLPALVVPLGTAALDHQQENAREFATTTGIWWTREDTWSTEAVAEQIAALAASPAGRAAAAARLAAAARPHAAADVVAACEALRTARRERGR